MKLSKQKCIPCNQSGTSLTSRERGLLLKKLKPHWKISFAQRLVAQYEFKDFGQALDFVNRIAEIASELDHHPDIKIYQYRKLRLELYTHKTNSLHIADFVLAARIDALDVERFEATA